MDYKSRFAFIGLILTLSFICMFIVIASPVNAACYSLSNVQCTETPPAICDANHQCKQLSAGSCSSIPDKCEKGCCCRIVGPTTVGNYLIHDSCNELQGTFYSGIQETTCEAMGFCNTNPVNLYTISGYIKSANGTTTPPGATVKLNNINIFIALANGFYNFSYVRQGTSSTIYANTSQCHGQISVVSIQQNKNDANITLNSCCQQNCGTWGACINNTQQGICTDSCTGAVSTQTRSCNIQTPCQWNCTYSPCGTDGYRNVTCRQSPTGWIGCDGRPTQPPLRERCSNISGECGNGIIDNSETCDRNTTTNAFVSICVPYNNSNNCNFATCQCYLQPPVLDDCINNPGGITAFNANHVSMKKAFMLNWSIATCMDFIEHFKLESCNNVSGVCNFQTITSSIEPDIRAYFDNSSITNIRANKNYCYRLTAYYNGTVNPIERSKNATVCITAGDDPCLTDHASQWCGYDRANHLDTRLSCDDNNTLIYDNCDSGTYCTFSNDMASCVPQGPCDKCNNIFGLFGYQGFDITLTHDESGGQNSSLQCPSIQDPNPAPSDGIETGCYKDYTSTSIDKAYACSATISCYDYFSKDACEKDYCRKFTTVDENQVEQNQCEWTYYNQQFNKGVCRPKDITLQKCNYCTNPPNPTTTNLAHNRIYPQCTQDTCGLYGYCYFSNASTNGGCLNGSSVICSQYTSQNDCTGRNGGVLINITYSNTGIRISGTNALIRNSNDTMGIGKCAWINNACIRDADNNRTNDCRSNGLTPTEYLMCERDNIPPTTIINNKPSYGRIMNLNGAVQITDNNPWAIGDNITGQNPRKTIWMYYCIAENGGLPCYPKNVMITTGPASLRYRINLSAARITNLNEDGTSGLVDGRLYIFYYFSEDPGKNLEKIKNFTFRYDSIPPMISIRKDLNAFMIGEDDWRTNLTITIGLNNTESSLPVQCTFNLHPTPNSNIDFSAWETYNIPSDVPPYLNNITYNGGNLHTMYPFLPNARYIYALECIDNAGNSYTENGNITIDDDIRINSPYPAGETFTSHRNTISGQGNIGNSMILGGGGEIQLDNTPKGTNIEPPNPSPPPVQPNSITLSINTSKIGDCRYSATTTEYNSMNGTFMRNTTSDPDNYYHSAPFIWNINDPSASRIYRFYTACNLVINGVNKIVKGDAADWIYFAVDDAPPVTTLMDASNDPTPYTYQNSSQSLALSLKCDDSKIELIDYDNTSMVFGCDTTYYCIRNRLDNTACNTYGYTELAADASIELNYVDPDSPDRIRYGNDPVICYYSKDLGGNTENRQCTPLNLRNTDFEDPDISITSGD